MLPAGFLGTRADVLMDLVICSLAIILPLLALTVRWAREGRYGAHKSLQIWLTSSLAVAVTLFEIDMNMAGGLAELTRGSPFHGTALMKGSVYFHLPFAFGTSLVWLGLIIASLRRFGTPPGPNDFSSTHRRWGWIGVTLMAITGLSGLELYIVGFAM